jgi:hypothetical protein
MFTEQWIAYLYLGVYIKLSVLPTDHVSHNHHLLAKQNLSQKQILCSCPGEHGGIRYKQKTSGTRTN